MITRILLLTCALIALISTSTTAATATYDQSPFGVNYLKWHYFDHPGGIDELRTKMRIMKDAGIYWDRDAFGYGDIHPKPDVWKWDHYDKCIALAKQERINLIGLLLGGPQPDTAERRKDYGEYVYQVVNRYKDSVKIWEIWNEPNIPSFWQDPDVKLYTLLVKEAYAQAKKADPTCTVIIGSTSGPGTDWFNGIHANGGWDYCDGISIHPYAMAGNPIEQGLDETLRLLKKQFASFGKPKPIWTTEVGWRASKPGEEEDQATAIVQTYVIHIANGIQNMAYFCMDDYDGWGFVKSDRPLRTKRAYDAMQSMTVALGHVPQFVGYLKTPDGVACYVFKKGANERVLVLWSNDKTRRTFRLAQTKGLTAKDILNRPVRITAGSITIGPTPIFVYHADVNRIGKVSMAFNPYLTKPGQNLIVNPSMDAAGGHPHGWTPGRFFSTDNKGTFDTTKQGRNGSTCVSISKSTAPAAWDASPLPVDPDKTYTLTAWVKTKDATGKNAVAMYFYNGNQWGVVGTPTTQSITGTNDWAKVTVSGKPPKDAAIVRVNLISEGNTGTTWFDDVTLTED